MIPPVPGVEFDAGPTPGVPGVGDVGTVVRPERGRAVVFVVDVLECFTEVTVEPFDPAAIARCDGFESHGLTRKSAAASNHTPATAHADSNRRRCRRRRMPPSRIAYS
jgi:hypothetical protein